MKTTQVISTEEDFKKVIDLRKSILHPKGPIDRIHYPSDSDQTRSYHLVIFDEQKNEILACGTLLMEDEGENPSTKIARIRGMAVSEKFQGLGFGALILDGLIKESIRRRVEKIWCNARTKILNFYLKKGFVSVGDEFVIAGGIPHYKLLKTISYKDEIK